MSQTQDCRSMVEFYKEKCQTYQALDFAKVMDSDSDVAVCSHAMNRRDFIASAAVGTAALALPRLGFLYDSELSPIWAQIQKQHAETVQRLPQWILPHSLAAENRGMTEG